VNLPLYERSLPAVAANVGALRRGLTEALVARGTDAQRVGDVALVVSEALSNAAVHAYVGRSPGPVALAAAVSYGTLRVTVTDLGRGMIPRTDSPGLGLGVVLMGRLADVLEISEPAAGGTEVCARFSL
jgi:anti-sigma regulatory factor (Ser/Thr protein kinase)